MAESSIEWTDATWNPVTGCSKVSPGCAHCYAEALTMRFASSWGVPRLPWTPTNAAENVILHPDRLRQPLRWKKRRMVFVNSMSDLFHEQVPDEFIAEVFRVMSQTPRHTFQVLTKRPERMRDWITAHAEDMTSKPWNHSEFERIYPNVWFGVSIENRRFVHRADLLRQTPAAVRFISAEPLLGPLIAPHHIDVSDDPFDPVILPMWDDQPGAGGPDELDLTDIDWLIVGGESGPKARMVDANWVRALRAEAIASSTRFFFKQWGGVRPQAGGRVLDGRTWDDMPEVVAHA